ncbi:MAG: hypothetical protein MI717_09540 [Spirochaetales bacterium]|nr:hypothetical protein [Spirochaetales bacterium]
MAEKTVTTAKNTHTTKAKKIKKSTKKNRKAGGWISFILLLIAAGATFWFGWIQFKIGEGQYAVIHTKTRGYRPTPIKAGEFFWTPEALLPTNLTLHIFDTSPQSTTLSLEGALPSAQAYGDVVPGLTPFSWNITLRVTYRLNPTILPKLVEQGFQGGQPETLYTEFEASLQGILTQHIPTLMEGSFDLLSWQKTLMEAFSASSPKMEVQDLAITKWSLPDRELYNEARRLTLERMEAVNAVRLEAETTATRRDTETNARLDTLERYGSVLEEHPVLLEFFALDGNPGASLLPPSISENL